ncbi:MAG TPA: M23 family metallopeptidase [Arthrobacter sp.]|nr:M23 family metallopeptidase [Arthrobacter sp.]
MIRPVDFEPSQLYGDNPTKWLPADSWLIQTFGNYQPDGHTGIDYPCPAGTPVRAVAAGTVVHVGRLAGTYADNAWWISPGFAGFTYVVDHGSFIGIYGHCMDGAARVSYGQRVSEGQVLGLSGNTGASTGDHLHFEVLPDGYVLNSYMYGRINPATLFGSASINPQGTITPQEEEDDMALSTEDKLFIQNEIERRHAVTRDLIRSEGFSYANKVFLQETVESRAVVTRDVIRAAVATLATFTPGIDQEKLEKALTDAVAEAIAAGITVDVKVGTTDG